MNNNKQLYTIKEFAQKLNVHQQTLRRWDKLGKLKPIKLPSGHRRYTQEMFDDLFKKEI